MFTFQIFLVIYGFRTLIVQLFDFLISALQLDQDLVTAFDSKWIDPRILLLTYIINIYNTVELKRVRMHNLHTFSQILSPKLRLGAHKKHKTHKNT